MISSLCPPCNPTDSRKLPFLLGRSPIVKLCPELVKLNAGLAMSDLQYGPIEYGWKFSYGLNLIEGSNFSGCPRAARPDSYGLRRPGRYAVNNQAHPGIPPYIHLQIFYKIITYRWGYISLFPYQMPNQTGYE